VQSVVDFDSGIANYNNTEYDHQHHWNNYCFNYYSNDDNATNIAASFW